MASAVSRVRRIDRELAAHRRVRWVEAGVAILSCLLVLVIWPRESTLTPDSSAYLGWDPIRTIGYPILLVLSNLWLGSDGKKKWLLSFAPLLLILAMGGGAQWARHGTFRAKGLLGLNLLGKTAFLAPNTVDRHSSIHALIEAEMSEARDADRKLHHWWERYSFRADYYNALRFGVVRDATRELAKAQDRDPNELRTDVALDAIAADPKGYLGDVLLNYAAIWLPPHVQTSAAVDVFRERVAPAPLPPMLQVGRSPPIVFVFKAVMAILFLGSLLASLLALFALLKRAPPPAKLAPALLLGLAVQLYTVSVALVQSAQDRYLLAFWPWLILTFVLQLANAKQLVRSRLRAIGDHRP